MQNIINDIRDLCTKMHAIKIIADFLKKKKKMTEYLFLKTCPLLYVRTVNPYECIVGVDQKL